MKLKLTNFGFLLFDFLIHLLNRNQLLV